MECQGEEGKLLRADLLRQQHGAIPRKEGKEGKEAPRKRGIHKGAYKVVFSKMGSLCVQEPLKIRSILESCRPPSMKSKS